MVTMNEVNVAKQLHCDASHPVVSLQNTTCFLLNQVWWISIITLLPYSWQALIENK